VSEPAHERIIQASTAGGKDGWISIRSCLPVAGILLIALALKLGLLAADAFPFNADEAVVGLMARHILQGSWPAFFYGQAYMGSLDATLVAGAFSLAGVSIVAIRVVQALLYLGTVGTTILIGRRYLRSRRIGILAGLLMAIPAVNVTLYSTVSLGGYGEALLIGNMTILLAMRIQEKPTGGWAYFIWGLLAGLGFWAFGLTLVYTIPTAFLLGTVLWRLESRRLQRVLLALLGLVIGALPWIVFAISRGLSPLLSELGGSAIAVESGLGAAGNIASRLMSLVVFGSTVILGLRPPWDINWLALPLAPIVLAFWSAVLLHSIRTLRKREESADLRWLWTGTALCLFLGFLFTPFGGDPSGRYFLPLVVPMALMGAEFIEKLRERSGGYLAYGLTAIVLLFNLWGTLQSKAESPTGLTTQFDGVTRIDHRYDADLIAFLEEHDERRGYSNYWVSYPLAFQSREEIIFIPRLPYHPDFRYTERDDRYIPYTEIVEDASRVAYITTHHPDLNLYLRDAFADLEIEYREIRIGDYQVFYALSKRVSPEEIGLGHASP
jgi:hypothetical protein